MDIKNFNLANYAKINNEMIATTETSYSESVWSKWHSILSRARSYTAEEIQNIIESGNLNEQQRLSRNYFYKDGYYKKIILHYATLLKYVGILIPNPMKGNNLSTSHVLKRYDGALDYLELMSLPTFLTNCAQRALIDGSYFGAITKSDKDRFSVIDLPSGYCSSRFKDEQGNDLIEFDVSYFDTITDKDIRKTALNVYPKAISSAYRKWDKKKELENKTVIVPSNIGICFPLFDGKPLFLSIIPKILEYEEAVLTERERDAEEIRKIIVQKIPHLNDGKLVFEPEEAAEMHTGTVGMLKNNKNISVLTTYGEVEAIGSKTSVDSANNIMERMEQNIYAKAGVSGQIFAPTGSSSLEKSLENDLALMMSLANKFSVFITNILNTNFGNSNINFKYTVLPVSYYNSDKYIESTFKLVNSGYSFLLPSIAMGLNQKDLINVKNLENDVLKLSEKLIPLSTAYTESSAKGRPELDEDKKKETTVTTEEARENAGGSNK